MLHTPPPLRISRSEFVSFLLPLQLLQLALPVSLPAAAVGEDLLPHLLTGGLLDLAFILADAGADLVLGIGRLIAAPSPSVAMQYRVTVDFFSVHACTGLYRGFLPVPGRGTPR